MTAPHRPPRLAAPRPRPGHGLTLRGHLTAFGGIAGREILRFTRQRERFLSALVRPLVWLFIFAAGFRAVLGLSITPPYQTYVLYEVYVTPGLCAMIQLFNGMQSLALDGLRPRDRRDADASRQPLSALVPSRL